MFINLFIVQICYRKTQSYPRKLRNLSFISFAITTITVLIVSQFYVSRLNLIVRHLVLLSHKTSLPTEYIKEIPINSSTTNLNPDSRKLLCISAGNV